MEFKKILEDKGINIAELSKACDIPYATLYNGIQKPNSIKAENLKKISDYLNITMDQLYNMLYEVQNNKLLINLLDQMKCKLKGNLYHYTQISFAYNTNRIEGSKLSEDETRYIFETNTLLHENPSTNINDIVETANHFYLFDIMLSEVNEILTQKLIKKYHNVLKNGTSDSRLDWFNVGDYKKLANEVGGKDTVSPEKVSSEMKKLLNWYNSISNIELNDIIEFHYRFECIHPFQDGNGRIGRIIMFKECLKNNIIPFIIEDNYKAFYYRGLSEYKREKGYLIDTCLSMQDIYKMKIIKYLGNDFILSVND